MSERDRGDKDQLWSEATLWFARMRSPDAEEFRPQFEEWLSRGALHRSYYNRASEHWLHGTAAYAEERARIHGTQEPRPAAATANRHKYWIIATVVGSAAALAGSTLWFVSADGRHHAGGITRVSGPRPLAGSWQFATKSGEYRSVHLSDGSIVSLGSSTFLRVQLGSSMRRLELGRGRARFDVAHESRPFVVFAGGGSVTAHGTLFDVGLSQGGRVSVRLIRGSIDVRFPRPAQGQDPSSPRLLRPGDTISFEAADADGGGQPGAAAAIPAQVRAARDYRDVQLAEIVDQANRDAAVPIGFADPALGRLRVSGRFRTDDSLMVADRLAALFHLSVDRSTAGRIILRPR